MAKRGANVKSQLEGQNHPPLEFKKLFILGAAGLDEDAWRETFSKFGEVIKVNINTDKKTGRQKGMCHVLFDKTSEACRALEQMNGQHIGGEKPLKIMFAQNKADNLEVDCDEDKMLQRLFVKCPKEFTDLDLTDYFGNFGNIEQCRILKDNQSRESRGLAFIKFSKQADAAKALEECDESYKARWADVRTASEEGSSSACFACGKQGHYSGECPSKNNKTSGDPYSNMNQMDQRNQFNQMNNPLMNSMGFGGGGFGSTGFNSGGFNSGGFGQRDFNSGGFNNSSGFNAGGQGFGSGASFGQSSFGPSQGGFGDNYGGAVAEDQMSDPLSIVENGKYSEVGLNILEALLPETRSTKQVYQLFNVSPGMESCSWNKKSCIAKVTYKTAKCAAYAKEKIDGFDYAGENIAVRFGKIKNKNDLQKTAVDLQQKLAQLTAKGGADPSELVQVMQSLTKVTDAIQNPEPEEDDSGEEMVPWCSVPLPVQKPLVGSSPVVARLFFVAIPDRFSDELLVNAFCRFGDLVSVRFQPDKRFGFAHYANQDSAEQAKAVLHGQYIANNRIKIEISDAPRIDGENAPSRKRNRDDYQ